MAEPTSDKHYEEKFEFPLWKLIKQRAKEKDISYHDAMLEVVPDFQKTIRYRDKEFEEAAIKKGRDELIALSEQERKLLDIHQGD
ncbi:hypothetical protein ACFLXD_05240 [Chloroflexota bacterium]